MLKGLAGVSTHEHSEWLPVLENTQDMEAMARTVEATLERNPVAHGFLLRRHGLYTWGKDLAEAKRHVEILAGMDGGQPGLFRALPKPAAPSTNSCSVPEIPF